MAFTYSGGVITQSNEASKSITAFASGGSNVLTVSVSAHGYAVGNLVEIKNTSNYNGVYLITAVTTNTFNVSTFTVDDIENTFVVTETGTVERGDADNSGLFGLTDVDRDDSGKKYTISNSVIEIEAIRIQVHFALLLEKQGAFFKLEPKKRTMEMLRIVKALQLRRQVYLIQPLQHILLPCMVLCSLKALLRLGLERLVGLLILR